MQLVCLDSLVKKDHAYRKFTTVLDFTKLFKPREKLSNDGRAGATGFGIETLFKLVIS